MVSRKTRTLLTTLIVILGCGVLGFLFYISDEYRAATPLVFLFGLIILLVPAINSFTKLLASPRRQTMIEARMAAQEERVDEARLWREGIPHLVTNLYFGHIQNYPEWINVSRDYVPSSVSNAGRTEDGSVRLLLYFTDYVFPYKEWQLGDADNANAKQAIVEVVREGQRVLSLRATQTTDASGGTHWEPVAVESFKTGDWIRDMQNLKAEIIAIIKDREREARES